MRVAIAGSRIALAASACRRAMIFGEVPAGACSPIMVATLKPLMPSSSQVLTEGVDCERRSGELVFSRTLVKEGRLGFWRWFLGAWGIGTYGRNDQVDLTWEVDGQPRVAHALDLEPAD